ncbi:MAG: acetoin dehydrogenase [Candidatus Sungbacteria bacterium RIFCSPLOWO2_01_FULL_59_16]|uniref:Acetoin dehydrogenase n=1 Tax=Candidatus Sungbacteria bacterium RIFCSPLOWO2_01_FULL_59_16 TaxID=1802280 RepID=A0A1G2LCR3_9BACT|nr:MAG: acetoin dehydrogenase [Candidatus Sungbacteria bacterium RIFCSPLOWO2_01_FULL_59_16]
MERIITYAEAIREATAQEMARDSSVFVLGMGVDDHVAMWGTTAGLQKKFGRMRVFDTPLSEDAMTGVAIGSALAGLRPIHAHIRMDFLLLATNQIVNIAAKARYMYGGAVKIPAVFRSVIGRSWGQGAQHSQALHSLFMHVPGLKVVAPSTPYDAKGALIQSIRDDNPVLFIEHRMLHAMRGHVPARPYAVPFGRARVLRKGSDVTIIAVSYLVPESLRAARLLEDARIRAEVIDPVSLSPLDMRTIVRSVKKTGRLLVADNAWLTCGAASEIITRTIEHFQGARLPVPKIARIGFQPVTCPPSRPLENLFYPNPRTIALAAHQLVRGKRRWTPRGEISREIAEFRGPF